jgi:hypothetical protein
MRQGALVRTSRRKALKLALNQVVVPLRSVFGHQGEIGATRARSANKNDLFYYDCLAAGQSWCVSNNYYGIHNIAAHEFGHWFHLLDTYSSSDNLDTMYGYSYTGEVQQRTPTAHDLDEAWIMYGCRNGGLTFYC